MLVQCPKRHVQPQTEPGRSHEMLAGRRSEISCAVNSGRLSQGTVSSLGVNCLFNKGLDVKSCAQGVS